MSYSLGESEVIARYFSHGSLYNMHFNICSAYAAFPRRKRPG